MVNICIIFTVTTFLFVGLILMLQNLEIKLHQNVVFKWLHNLSGDSTEETLKLSPRIKVENSEQASDALVKVTTADYVFI